MQLADTQLGMESGFTGRPGWDRELELMRKAAAEVNRLRPAFAIVCGDLVNEYPFEEAGRERFNDTKVREEQRRDFKEAFSSIDDDIPLICLCGNHDIGDRPNSATIRSYTENFGDDYFSFWCNGMKCLVVNSQLWKDDSDAKSLREDMDRWLESELEADAIDAEPLRMLVFSHVPPFINKADEKSEYFNLERDFRQELLAKLSSRGVVAWFCGHYHRNAGGVFRDSEGRELEVVVTAAVGTQITDQPDGNPLGKSGIGGHCIGDEFSGLRLVKVHADRIQHQWLTFSQLQDMPASEATAC
jgi:3',5'-cyclic AMP phosphodiesterase CpdA